MTTAQGRESAFRCWLMVMKPLAIGNWQLAKLKVVGTLVLGIWRKTASTSSVFLCVLRSETGSCAGATLSRVWFLRKGGTLVCLWYWFFAWLIAKCLLPIATSPVSDRTCPSPLRRRAHPLSCRRRSSVYVRRGCAGSRRDRRVFRRRHLCRDKRL